MSNDLCQKLITDKDSGKIITVHRIGSGAIRSDQDLILAVQDSIMSALSENGLENHGEESLKEAALKWLEKDANREYFNTLIHEDEYAWAFGGEDVTTIIKKLVDNIEVQKNMRNILKVAEDNGITALRLDVQGMANWIKDIIAKNNLAAILFVWDEFTEFFQNNTNSLTGFQTLAEISLSHPFYFMIVSHESRSLFVNADTAKKILDRFVPPVKIELPENMAFRLMAKAMNVDLAFSGTDWGKGKGKSIAEKLSRDGLIFKKPVGGGKMEYTVANSTGDAATIEKKKQEIIAENSESMTVDKMKQMIANALNQKVTPNRNYKEEYIVEMSPEQKAFLSCTAKVFNIAHSQCGSIESARDQIRSRMKQLTFPIWCVKSLLPNENMSGSTEDISEVIDYYCGIANTANSTKSSESDLADAIGRKLIATSDMVEDLVKLITNEKCKAGMLEYIRHYRSGLLEKLALEIEDNGAYIDQVKQKFNADAANWVWNSETADEKINDVILEYQIIVESNKLNPKALSLHDAVIEWNKRTSNIRISYEALRKYVGTLEAFLEQLLLLQRSGVLQEQNKSKFYDCLLAEGNNFVEFYKNQKQYFKQTASTFIEDLDEQDIDKLYSEIPNGQFTKSSTEYFYFIEGQVKVFLQNQAKRKLLTFWKEKTGTKDPSDWSNTYQTPIYCMFSDEKRNNVKEMFRPFRDKTATEEMVTRTITYLEKADFYGRLSDAEERDRCFSQRLIGDYSVILTDVNEIRDYLISHVTESPDAWFDNSVVRNKLRSLCEKQYLLKGKDVAMEIIGNMDADEAKKYLCDLVSDNPTVGMEIIKNRKQ